jgi:hypothetical protein
MARQASAKMANSAGKIAYHQVKWWRRAVASRRKAPGVPYRNGGAGSQWLKA